MNQVPPPPLELPTQPTPAVGEPDTLEVIQQRVDDTVLAAERARRRLRRLVIAVVALGLALVLGVLSLALLRYSRVVETLTARVDDNSLVLSRIDSVVGELRGITRRLDDCQDPAAPCGRDRAAVLEGAIARLTDLVTQDAARREAEVLAALERLRAALAAQGVAVPTLPRPSAPTRLPASALPPPAPVRPPGTIQAAPAPAPAPAPSPPQPPGVLCVVLRIGC